MSRNDTEPTETHRISIVIATRNRAGALARTLSELEHLEIPRDEIEVIVVDNASTDESRSVAGERADRLIALPVNEGSCAKQRGAAVSCGEFVVFLDDDSFPHAGSLSRMIEHFENNPTLGAAGFRVQLESGGFECGALPNVFVGCGVGFRRDALQRAGGLDRTFFMQAEEYDLAFRIRSAGSGVETFDNLLVTHLKTPRSRRSERTCFYDIRNNLRVAGRHIPGEYYADIRDDLLLRYRWLADTDEHGPAFERGARTGLALAAIERRRSKKWRLPAEAFESFYRYEEIARRFREMADGGIRRISLLDFGKNALAFVRGAERAGIEIAAIADDRFSASERRYRGIPIVTRDEALSQCCEAYVISNCAGEFAARSAADARSRTNRPVFDWFGSQASAAPPIPARSPAPV